MLDTFELGKLDGPGGSFRIQDCERGAGGRRGDLVPGGDIANSTKTLTLTGSTIPQLAFVATLVSFKWRHIWHCLSRSWNQSTMASAGIGFAKK